MCFDGSVFYGEQTLKAICPDCLSDGRLEGMGITTCTGDSSELVKQLQELHPEKNEVEIRSAADELTQQLEYRTPHLVSWQDWDWPAANGNYCCFIGFGSKSLYKTLCGEEDSMEFFGSSIHSSLDDDSDPEYLWEEMPSKAIPDYKESSEYSLLFYVFKSLNSDQIITMWDEQ